MDPVAGQLLQWYDTNRRILPWREDPTPFHVWLSEIMLQQTRVEAVRDYYARFLAAIPDIPSLANASDDELLKLWQGLGYYSRVRNMKKAARLLCEQNGGALPECYAELVKLPGIGQYTAAAIASIAFGEAVPAADGNLIRIFARLTAYGENARTERAKGEAFAFYKEIFDREIKPADETWIRGAPERNVPGDLNQALMDLGATVCLPNTQPHCVECPLEAFCKAHAAGNETAFPYLPPKKERSVREMTVLVIRYRDQVVLRKRPEKGLLAGLYEFPNREGFLTEDEAVDVAAELGFHALRIKELPPAKHLFTHIEWDMRGFLIFADDLEDAAFAAKKGEPFLADIKALREIWSVPSAFAAYLGAAETILQ